MKGEVTRFRSLSVALKEIEPAIRNPELLQTGKPVAQFRGMLPREMLGNWLLCAVLNSISQPERLTFCTDPNGGDGIIWDTETDNKQPTEHVLVPNLPDRSAEDVGAEILKAIERKQSRGGAAYASGKFLVVLLLPPGGPWCPNRVARQLPEPLDFEEVMNLQPIDEGNYVYAVTCLDLSEGNAPTWCVRINRDFSSWTVNTMQ
jgi:hypothetical protein